MKNVVIALVACITLVGLGGCGYNTIQQQDEQVTAAWSDVANQYKRRADLIPNLVNVVKGYASHEVDVLTKVTEARTKATSITVDASVLSNEESFKRFQEAQGALSGSLSLDSWQWQKTILNSKLTLTLEIFRRR